MAQAAWVAPPAPTQYYCLIIIFLLYLSGFHPATKFCEGGATSEWANNYSMLMAFGVFWAIS